MFRKVITNSVITSKLKLQHGQIVNSISWMSTTPTPTTTSSHLLWHWSWRAHSVNTVRIKSGEVEHLAIVEVCVEVVNGHLRTFFWSLQDRLGGSASIIGISSAPNIRIQEKALAQCNCSVTFFWWETGNRKGNVKRKTQKVDILCLKCFLFISILVFLSSWIILHRGGEST